MQFGKTYSLGHAHRGNCRIVWAEGINITVIRLGGYTVHKYQCSRQFNPKKQPGKQEI